MKSALPLSSFLSFGAGRGRLRGGLRGRPRRRTDVQHVLIKCLGPLELDPRLGGVGDHGEGKGGRGGRGGRGTGQGRWG